MSDTREFVKPEKWGKDHLTTLAYIGYVIVHCEGIPDRNKMRIDVDLHPGLIGNYQARMGESIQRKYPTRLKGGEELLNHDDWSCAEDLEAAGILKWEGSGINPLFVFTDFGWGVHAALEKHISAKLPCEKFDIQKHILETA